MRVDLHISGSDRGTQFTSETGCIAASEPPWGYYD